MRQIDLRHQVAVVTGAASGIGRATASALRAAGAEVVGADLAEGEDVLACDVRDADAVDQLVGSVVARHGRLDVMVNVAGIASFARVADLDDAHLDRVVAVNVHGVVHGCAAAVRAMTPRGSGSIINMASAAAYQAVPGLAAYTMSKAAVVALTRVLAMETAESGIRVNAVAPGWIATPMTQRSGGRHPSVEAEIAAKASTPLGITGQPEDVAGTVVYLASDLARLVTGQILHVNGGTMMPG